MKSIEKGSSNHAFYEIIAEKVKSVNNQLNEGSESAVLRRKSQNQAADRLIRASMDISMGISQFHID